MTTDTFNFTDGTSGNILKSGFVYTATTGWASCQISYSPITRDERRAYFQFDTSSIPENAIIEKVELKLIDAAAQPVNVTASGTIYMGTFIGGTLNGDVGEWTAGNNVAMIAFASGTWFDLGSKGIANLSKTAETDIKIIGNYSGLVAEGRDFNTARDKSQLRVTYHVRPQVI